MFFESAMFKLKSIPLQPGIWFLNLVPVVSSFACKEIPPAAWAQTSRVLSKVTVKSGLAIFLQQLLLTCSDSFLFCSPDTAGTANFLSWLFVCQLKVWHLVLTVGCLALPKYGRKECKCLMFLQTGCERYHDTAWYQCVLTKSIMFLTARYQLFCSKVLSCSQIEPDNAQCQ